MEFAKLKFELKEYSTDEVAGKKKTMDGIAFYQLDSCKKTRIIHDAPTWTELVVEFQDFLVKAGFDYLADYDFKTILDEYVRANPPSKEDREDDIVLDEPVYDYGNESKPIEGYYKEEDDD